MITKKEEIQLNFDNLYPNIDLPETLSNLFGLPIKKITKESVILLDGEDERKIKTDVKQMTEDERIEFVRLLKPLLWWGE
ncbi:MAG: hypothetical protein U9P79_05505 [Candidatus Cloacimonadota bacterium]|nr:hypothetical protein [Candidatus Cloacimonadota bacterium]